jgi:signal transduction histidine kinase/phage shock protein PspC (stress-responsive transcriptional regulator)
VAGVAGGLGEQLGVDGVLVRLAFVVLSCAGGVGLVAYLVAWSLGKENVDRTPHRASPRQFVALAMTLSGLLLILREMGLWFGDGLFVSVTLAAAGSAIIWTRNNDRSAQRTEQPPGQGRHGRRTGRRDAAVLRILLGLPLVVAGMATFLATHRALAAARNLAFAVAVSMVGFGLVFGPWMWRLARQLAEERRERIRSEERADMAAHLHDSVLQTLALIQRSRDPQQMATLAHGQERELRSWLYGRMRAADQGAGTLSAALDEVAGRVELMHRVPVEVVAVGDRRLDGRLKALVDAAGEAMNNAARHSGAGVVSVYMEVEGDLVRLYVRDEGRGFNAVSVPRDRRGIAESIRGRMERNGGVAVIESAVGEGTEVRLEISLRTES